MSDFYPYSLEDLLQSPVRIVYAPVSVDVSTRIADIVSQETPYALQTGWLEGGATTGPAQVSRNLTVAGTKIQQETSQVNKRPTEVVRQVSAPFAEIRPELLQILEESPSIDTIAAAAHKSAEKQVAFGSILDLTRYRVAFIGRFNKDQGLVTESGGTTRGRMIAYIAHRCTIGADNVQIGFDEGNPATAALTFELEPDPTLTAEGTESGVWAIEQAGTIAAT